MAFMSLSPLVLVTLFGCGRIIVVRPALFVPRSDRAVGVDPIALGSITVSTVA
jgi:hypothetical protein